MINFDIVLEEMGFGRFQIFLVLTAACCLIPIATNTSAVVFLGYHGKSRCAFPNIDSKVLDGKVSERELQRIFIPWSDDKQMYSSCKRYNFNSTLCQNNSLSCLLNTSLDFHNNTVQHNATISGCTDGYWYDRSKLAQTVTTEWDLVCDRSSLNSLSTASFCFGMLIGSLFGGSAADKFGRLPAIISCSILNVVFGITCSFSPNFTTFIIMRFFIGASAVAIQIAMVVYTVEIVEKQHRPWTGMQVGIFSGIGYIVMSAIAYMFRHWRSLQLVLGLTLVPFLLMTPFVPESPRFLLSQGQDEKAKKICQKIALVNGRKLNENVWKRAAHSVDDDIGRRQLSNAPVELCRRPRVLCLLVAITMLWFVNSLVFFCLSFNVGHWSGNPFLNNALSGLVELIACLLVVPVINKMGRRSTTVAGLVVAGSLMLLVEVIKVILKSQDIGMAEVTILLIAKFTISGSFNLMFLYTAELFPTPIRISALGISSVGGRAASIVAPFLLQTQHFISWGVPVALGILAFITAAIAHKCPETKGVAMLSTVDEAEVFYKTHKHKYVSDVINNNHTDAILL